MSLRSTLRSSRSRLQKMENDLTVVKEAVIVSPAKLRPVENCKTTEQEEDCADVFGIVSRPLTEEAWMADPELIAEEDRVQKVNEEIQAKASKEEMKCSNRDGNDLSPEERYNKLYKLLKTSKFYSDFLLQKMSTEDEEAKILKQNKLKNRVVFKRQRECTADKADTSLSKKSKLDHHQQEKPSTPSNILQEQQQPTLLEGGVLRDYQLKGYQWLSNLYENGINGILADEMGLGKTLQTIALLCHLIEMGVEGPFLIVAPLSTIANWVRELKKFAPRLPCVLYHGAASKRTELRHSHIGKSHVLHGFGAESRRARCIFVTSYGIAINDRVHFANVRWRYVVVDEGHRLKNFSCRLLKELKRYDTANRLLLTGTPLQNNLDELWSLLNFIMPDIFDDLRIFRSWFDAKDLDQNTSETQRILRQEQEGNILNTLHQILTPFLLRRVKCDVDLKIPPKKEVLVYCPMSQRQLDLYEATLNSTIQKLVDGCDNQKEETAEYDCDGRSKRRKVYKTLLDNDSNFQPDQNYFEKMRKIQGVSQDHNQRRDADVRICLKNRMMDLRKATNHPYLIEYPLTEDGMFYKADEDMIDISGKLKVLDQMLNELIKRQHKVLVFSQMVRLLDILGDYLNLRQFKFSRLDGGMSYEDRQVNIDTFSDDPNVNIFLLSTRSGGLGLNLTTADTVIIFDSDWNPQQDLQAQDRAHRIGQDKPVMVYRLVTANTIDEKIVERAAAKRKLEKMIIHRKKFKSQDMEGLKTTMEAISPEELVELLNSKDHSRVIDRKDGPILSTEDIELLLDRSDLTLTMVDQESLLRKTDGNLGNKSKNNKRSCGKKKNVKRGKSYLSAQEQNKGEGSFFKVIDTEGCL